LHYDTMKLIRMATQMADFFRNQPDRPPAEAIASHINDNWAPQMRQDFVALIAQGAEADPAVRDAAALVRVAAAS
jgi:formate dehydrogenase subunit delta